VSSECLRMACSHFHFLQGRGIENRMSVVYLPKVGFALRLDESTLPPDIAEELPDFEFAFDQVCDCASKQTRLIGYDPNR